jgi:hypothetical protein
MLYLDGHVDTVRHRKDTGRNVWKYIWNNPPP